MRWNSAPPNASDCSNCWTKRSTTLDHFYCRLCRPGAAQRPVLPVSQAPQRRCGRGTGAGQYRVVPAAPGGTGRGGRRCPAGRRAPAPARGRAAGRCGRQAGAGGNRILSRLGIAAARGSAVLAAVLPAGRGPRCADQPPVAGPGKQRRPGADRGADRRHPGPGRPAPRQSRLCGAAGTLLYGPAGVRPGRRNLRRTGAAGPGRRLCPGLCGPGGVPRCRPPAQ